MRIFLIAVTALLWTASIASAAVGCVGRNVLADVQRDNPAEYAALFQRAHQVPNAQGRFWRVDGRGSAPSYLFGTFHTNEAVRTVTPEVWGALDASRIALFELTIAEQHAMQDRIAADPAFAFDQTGAPLSQRLDPQKLRVLGQALSTRGIALESAEYMRPWLLFTILGFPACHLQAIAAGDEPLDKVMAQRAGDRKIPTLGLETYEQALAAFQRINPRRFLSMLVETSALVETEEDTFRTNADLYADGEIVAINEFGIWLSDRQGVVTDGRALNAEVMRELIDVRNQAWMQTLLPQIARGGAFTAVGALHLPGRMGLIEMLRAEGYTVTRLD